MKVLMKLKRRHPNNVMSFGRFMITTVEQALELNKSEVADLKNEGPQFWFSVAKVDEVVKTKKKVSKKVSKKAA